MKVIAKNKLRGLLCCLMVVLATVCSIIGISAFATENTIPTGTNTQTLTAEIKDSELDTFKVHGASVRTVNPAGLRFLATIEQSDLALIPNDAEFGILIIPSNMLNGELTKDTKSVLEAKAKVVTNSSDVPDGGMGYYISLVGKTLESAFPEGLFNTVFSARAYVKYTYESNGEIIEDYAYSSQTLCRSIAYVASCELTVKENAGADVSGENFNFLNTIIGSTAENASLSPSYTELGVGDEVSTEMLSATDGVNDYKYNLKSDNESVVKVEKDKLVAVSVGSATITANIGTKRVSVTVTVVEQKSAQDFTSGSILYSTADGKVFMPDGLLKSETEFIVSATGVSDGIEYFNEGDWSALAQTAEQINKNEITTTSLLLKTNEGGLYNVDAKSYAGVIDELADFPRFFNNTGVQSEFDSSKTSVAPNVYGYYIVTKDLGSASTELALTQTAETDYNAANGFNGVLDGQGHKLQFNLTSGGLVGMILGNAKIKNLAVQFSDNTSGYYGVFGYRVGGNTVIENCYIERTNNPSKRTSIYGIVACTNKKLDLKNTVVHGGQFSNAADWYSNMYISTNSSNAFLIYARLDKGADTWGISANFTEIVDGGALTSDLSSLDANYWNTANNSPSWKGVSDMAVSVYDRAFIEDLDEEFMYSSKDGEMVLPDGVLDGDEVVDATDEDGEDCFEDGVWSNCFALTTSQINANETKETDVVITTANGKFYNVTVKSYAGVIDEFDDFATFFNNDPTQTAPDVYGYYIVAKDLGSADSADESRTFTNKLALTQSQITNYETTNGFNGVLDGQGHTLQFELQSGGLVGLILGKATIKNLGVIFRDSSFVSEGNGGYGAFGYMANGATVIDNCYIERVQNNGQKYSVFGIMARPNNNLILTNTLVYGYYINQNCSYWGEEKYISGSSTDAYVIRGRSNTSAMKMAKNFTGVNCDNLWEASRDMPLSDVEDVSKFNDNYWYKQNGKLIWKGFNVVDITWVYDEENIVVESATQHGFVYVPEIEGHWSATEGGDTIGANVKASKNSTYYAVYAEQTVTENALYSTLNREFFLPDSMGLTMDEVSTITSEDGATVYYEDGAWYEDFDLTDGEITANAIKETTVKISDGNVIYYVTVKSYAGVIDDFADFATFFNNDPTQTVPDVYGYYIITKNLGTTTGSNESRVFSNDLALTQSKITTGASTNGFNGVLDGQGHTLQFNLQSGGLVGLILGEATIKNVSVIFKDSSFISQAEGGGYGAFGYMTNGATVMENCYVERIVNIATRSSVFGIMARPENKLIVKNTLVYGYYVNNDCTWYSSNNSISPSSTNAFIIQARSNTTSMTMATNFTVIAGQWEGPRELALSQVSDASGFNDCWSKENDVISWKGTADSAVSCVDIVEINYANMAENGVTRYAIVLPDGADATLTKAKDELVHFFEEATGVTLEVVENGGYSSYDAIISIGETEAFTRSGLSLGSLSLNSEGYYLKTVNNSIYINANTSVGCLYGVYGLLEELFGYEQFSEDTYSLTAKTTLAKPATLDKAVNPSFEMRMRSNGALVNNSEYASRMKMVNGELDYMYRVGDYTNNGGAGWLVWHNAFEILPPSYWQDSKSNWFSDDGTQLCYTAHGNTDDYNAMVEQIALIMEQTLSSSQITNYPNALFYTLTSEDTETCCTCSTCTTAKSTYGSNSGAVIKLCNDVQAKVSTWMDSNPAYKRDITLLFFAYNEYIDAPTAGTIEMRSDVGVMYAISKHVNYYFDINNAVNDEFRGKFDAWADLTAVNNSAFTVWTYSKNFQMYMLRADVYGDNAFFNQNAYQYFANAGVDFFFNQGATNGTTTLSAFEKLNGYIDAQMMWNCNQQVSDLTDEWFNAMFGAGATYMRSLYDSQNTVARQVFGTSKTGIPSVQFNKSEDKEFLTEDLFNTWFGYIDSAKSAIANDGTLTDAQKATLTAHVDEEWLSVEFLYVYIYCNWYSITFDRDAAKDAFREVLGYDSSTGTYAKDVVLLENAGCTLTEWIESDFTESV
ncbi:MAG: DUF4838 domain-containing protein [Clostridia bacterium]|nr:DUF4838 domain-containing protein [Clostridia bacterium]